MSLPLEHDYIGLSEPSPVERSYCSSAHSSTEDLKASALNLKQTELRLGLPGSQSPERNQGLLSLSINKKPNGYPLNSSKTNLVSGAKRGFSDAINDGFSEKWGFGSEDVKGAALLFSPKGESNAKALQQVCVSGQVKKEVAASVVAQSTKAGQEKQKKPQVSENVTPPAAKAQVVGWPPIRSFRKNTMASNLTKNNDDAEVKQGSGGCLYVKVSMDGAPYLRKVDLNMYNNYMELSMALEKMFSCFIIGKCNSKGLPEKDSLRESRLMDLLPGSEYVLTFEDKDVDWMLVGDVPWGMFTETCRKLRIMKGSEAIGLAPRAVEKCKN